MAVERRELENDDDSGTLFERPKLFHNTKTDVVILLFGVEKNGNYFGARLMYSDDAIRNDQLAEFFPAAFWKLVSLPEVVEIDVLDLPYFKALNAQNN